MPTRAGADSLPGSPAFSPCERGGGLRHRLSRGARLRPSPLLGRNRDGSGIPQLMGPVRLSLVVHRASCPWRRPCGPCCRLCEELWFRPAGLFPARAERFWLRAFLARAAVPAGAGCRSWGWRLSHVWCIAGLLSTRPGRRRPRNWRAGASISPGPRRPRTTPANLGTRTATTLSFHRRLAIQDLFTRRHQPMAFALRPLRAGCFQRARVSQPARAAGRFILSARATAFARRRHRAVLRQLLNPHGETAPPWAGFLRPPPAGQCFVRLLALGRRNAVALLPRDSLRHQARFTSGRGQVASCCSLRNLAGPSTTGRGCLRASRSPAGVEKPFLAQRQPCLPSAPWWKGCAPRRGGP